MKKLMILTALMLSSIIVSNACINAFNNNYNQAETQYGMSLSFCNYNFLYSPGTDDFCREMAYLEYNRNVVQAINDFEDCSN